MTGENIEIGLDAALMAAQMSASDAYLFASFAEPHRGLLAKFASLDPIKTATSFAALLMRPEFQSNCLRLEVLVHLALVTCKGERKPPDKFLTQAYTAFGNGFCGRMEDPAEDVFVSNVATPRGNFRVLEGIWEAGGFWLQRAIDVVEEMPRGSGYDDLRNSIYALLKMSDVACARAGLRRWDLGSDRSQATIPKKVLERMGALRSHLRFSEEELEAAGIDIEALGPFVFDPRDRQRLLTEKLGHSALELRPAIGHRGEAYLVLPTAVSAAIRRMVVDRMERAGMTKAFARGLAQEYSMLLSREPLLGGRGTTNVEFQFTKVGYLASAVKEVDRGRYLNLVFVLDDLEDFAATGLIEPRSLPEGFDNALQDQIAAVYDLASKRPDYRSGITLIVGCGLGRAIAMGIDARLPPGWRIEFASAADLTTLGGLSDFTPLSLWRVLDAEERVAKEGVRLQNINGLLNMVAWSRTLDGHLVPHALLPDGFVSGAGPSMIMIDQNGLRALRHEMLLANDPHVEQDVSGTWRRVRKPGESFFEEDRERPFYYGVDGNPDGRGLPGIYVTSERPWWCETDVPPDTEAYFASERWTMATTWLKRAAPVLEREIPGLPAGPILWRSRFQGVFGKTEIEGRPVSFPEARTHVAASADLATMTITLEVAAGFEQAFFNIDNVAERAIVNGLVEGAALLARASLGEAQRSAIVDVIMGGTAARQTHAFRSFELRDRLRETLPRVTFIDQGDDAIERLGLGWRVRDRTASPIIEGKAECIGFANALVKSVEDQLCEELRAFDREAVVRMALLNHEAAIVDRNQWSRTAAAVLALHNDKQAARDAIADHEFKLNAVFQATRTLVEFAICECPLSGGQTPGTLDLARLMIRPAFFMHAGGWSDAIRWDVMEPKLRITPLGDVHANWQFQDAVVEPYARTTNDARITDAIDRYADHLKDRPFAESIHDAFDPAFLAAWKEQTGAMIDEFRLFIDAIEDMALRQESLVFTTNRSELLSAELEGKSLEPNVVKAILDFLTFKPRAKWRDVPDGCLPRDLHPWRFRRQLSVLRRPLVELEDSENPRIVVAPGVLRDAFGYMVSNYLRGDFPDPQLSPLMLRWKARQADQRGHEFTLKVSERLRELGWETDTEVKITRLLSQGFERDYGDVDVLAWNRVSGRVLAIECKDLQYRKTPGEMAEQLSDFRGESTDGKRDSLAKHLDRMSLIARHMPEVATFVRMDKLAAVESHLVFANPVPMQFALNHMAERVKVGIYDQLAAI